MNKDMMATGKAAAQRQSKKMKSFFNGNVEIVKEIIAVEKLKRQK